MLLARTYYRLKPFLPQSCRIALRRWRAERRRRIFAHEWPIKPSAARVPKDWIGWPNGKKFAFVLTHDVEGQRGLDGSRALAELEMSIGFRSSFNFVPEGEYAVSEEFRRFLTEHGFEVGVHDLKHDGKLYWSRETFRRHAQSINQYLRSWDSTGFRSGFMHHNLEWLHDLDVLYDCSTFDTDPFEPQPDGVGTIFPFWVSAPHIRNSTPTANGSSEGKGYVELPYTLPQDFTLFLVLREGTIDIWKRKLDWIVSSGGMALIDTHPDYMTFDGPPRPGTYPVRHYREFLEYVRAVYKDHYWHALPNEVARLVHPRHQAPITNARVEELSLTEIRSRRRATATHLKDKHAAVVLYSYYPSDPRPRRAAEALAEQGMVVDLICLKQSDDEPKREVINGVRVHRLPIQRRRGGKMTYVFQYLAFIVMSFALLAFRSFRKRYDLVHVHNMPDVLVFSALFPKLRGAKVVLDLHDPMPELMMTIFKLRPDSLGVSILRLLEKWSIRFANLALTPNRAFRDLFIQRSSSPEKMQIVMNSPEEEIFRADAATSPLQRNGHPFRILYHGSIVQRHGLDTAVEAVALLEKKIPGLTLDICGASTPYLDSVLALAKQRGLDGCVTYLGGKSQTEIARLIANSHLGIIPNRRSPFTEINMPTRIFEYLAMNKPVVAPSTRGIRDYFDHENLLFFEPDDAADLARAMEWVYQNPREADAIVQRGVKIYREHLWSEEKERFIGAMDSLLARRS